MSLGSLLLNIRTKFKYGVRIAYWRDFVRPKILRTAPVVCTDDTSVEIHVLTCEGDWLNLMWMLKSFYHYARRHYSLCIHDDGSLSSTAKNELDQHFPRARLIERRMGDEVLNDRLRDMPLSRSFRNINPLAIKVYDFAEFLESPRMLLLDSDILFFGEPKELLDRIEDSTYDKATLNKDWGMGYTIAPDAIQPMVDFPVVSHINSGLGLLFKKGLDFASYERFLSIPGVLGHPHRIEQTLIALACSKFGFEFLPHRYDVRIEDGAPVMPCKHYTGPIRHLMYREGFRYLVACGFLTM